MAGQANHFEALWAEKSGVVGEHSIFGIASLRSQ